MTETITKDNLDDLFIVNKVTKKLLNKTQNEVMRLEDEKEELFYELEAVKQMCIELELQLNNKQYKKKTTKRKRHIETDAKEETNELAKELTKELAKEANRYIGNLRPKRQRVKFDKNKAYFDAVK